MRKRWNSEMVREFVEGEGEGYELVSVPNWDYVKAKDRIIVNCGSHEEYDVRWNDFQQGSRCPKCKSVRLKKHFSFNHEEICKKISELDNKYKVLDDSLKYENNKTKLKLSCGEHEYFASWAEFKSGNRCPKCSKYRNRYNHDEICKEIQKLDSEYSVCDDSPVYENAYTKLKLYHSVCENEFNIRWNNFKSGDRPCGCHSNSKNEILLREYLKSKNIKFSEQVTFDGLKSERKLRYDFGIYENDEISILVEFDGEQHFKAIKHFGGQEQFIKTQYHDKLKNDYAEKNNIPLFRFTYKDKFNEIEKMLNFILDITLAS